MTIILISSNNIESAFQLLMASCTFLFAFLVFLFRLKGKWKNLILILISLSIEPIWTFLFILLHFLHGNFQIVGRGVFPHDLVSLFLGKKSLVLFRKVIWSNYPLLFFFCLGFYPFFFFVFFKCKLPFFFLLSLFPFLCFSLKSLTFKTWLLNFFGFI